MMWWYHGTSGAGVWLVMTLMMLIFWGGLVVLFGWLLRSGRRSVSCSGPAKADDVLAERYARGEIDDEEFQRRREVLRTATPSAAS